MSQSYHFLKNQEKDLTRLLLKSSSRKRKVYLMDIITSFSGGSTLQKITIHLYWTPISFWLLSVGLKDFTNSQLIKY